MSKVLAHEEIIVSTAVKQLTPAAGEYPPGEDYDLTPIEEYPPD